MKIPDESFTVEISKTSNICATGEKAGSKNMQEGKIPVMSCEGACIRGEIARQAANYIAKEEPYRRGCHGELLTAPSSALSQWVKNAKKIVLIDGCPLRCHGRILENLVGAEKLIQFDAYSMYKKYSEFFDVDSVPEKERLDTARTVANTLLKELQNNYKGKTNNG